MNVVSSYTITMSLRVISLLFLIFLTGINGIRYVLPNVKLEAIRGGGLRASIPVQPGEDIELFGFHANVNQNIRGKEQGTISRSATQPTGNRWTVIDRNVQLNMGDKIYYWVFAQSQRLGFDREDQVIEVKEFVTISDTCEPSISMFNRDETVCKGEVIFEDDFTNNNIDENIWNIHSYIPTYLESYGDNEFVSYENNGENLFISNGVLNIKPRVRKSSIQNNELDLSEKCTFFQADDKLREFACKLLTGQKGRSPQTIVPPVVSARISSVKSFKYGRVEVRAKLSKGSWIVPQAVLLPKDYNYGPGIKSGSLYVVYATGNENFKDAAGKNAGWGNAKYGPVVDNDKNKNLKSFEVDDAFHTYSIEWTPNSLIHRIDNQKILSQNIPQGGYSSLVTNHNSAGNWLNSQKPDAPFDQYMNLHLAVAVGGRTDFPDNFQYDVTKPWNNGDPKAVISFKKQEKQWEKTWGGHSNFQIDYIKVYAL